MEREKICFLIGHRETKDRIFEKLLRTMEVHVVEYGVKEFVVGRYGNFDGLAAKAAKEIKKKFTEVRLTLLLPYHPAEYAVELPKGFDGTLYPAEMGKVPKRAAIVKANRYMVAHSGYLICYVDHTGSNAGEILEYAKKREKRNLIQVCNLAE